MKGGGGGGRREGYGLGKASLAEPGRPVVPVCMHVEGEGSEEGRREGYRLGLDRPLL